MCSETDFDSDGIDISATLAVLNAPTVYVWSYG